MNERTATRLAWSLAFVCFAMVAASLVLVYQDRASFGSVGFGDVSSLIPTFTLAGLGALVASRRQTNAIGWLLLTIATFVGLSVVSGHIAMHALLVGASPHGWPRWPAWVENSIGQFRITALLLMLLLFPDGRPLNRRWRWIAWATLVLSIGFVIGTALDPTPVQLSAGLPSLGNPIGLSALTGFSNSLAFLVIVLFFVIGVVALLVRLRRSKGEERQQLKWFVYAAVFSVSLLVVGIPLHFVSDALSNAFFSAAFVLGFSMALPGAAALAILRYGLYEIDVIINKTLVYFCLAAVITAIYVGIVVGVGAVIGARGNVGLSLLATAIVAVGFPPIRARSRRFANRLVYGKRATP
jgi:two-component system NarL family sensor kinase